MLRSYEKRHALGSLQGVLSSPVTCSSITESLPIVICLRSKVWFVFPAAASVSSDQPNQSSFVMFPLLGHFMQHAKQNLAKLYNAHDDLFWCTVVRTWFYILRSKWLRAHSCFMSTYAGSRAFSINYTVTINSVTLTLSHASSKRAIARRFQIHRRQVIVIL